jgi:hypothetical protein
MDNDVGIGEIRFRYPVRAYLAVALASLLFLTHLIAGTLFVALMIPLIPLFIGSVMTTGNVLTAALDYARAQAVPIPVTRPESRRDPRPRMGFPLHRPHHA